MDSPETLSFVKPVSPAGASFDLNSFKNLLGELQESKSKQKKGFVSAQFIDELLEEV
jgi:hypothetical protein